MKTINIEEFKIYLKSQQQETYLILLEEYVETLTETKLKRDQQTRDTRRAKMVEENFKIKNKFCYVLYHEGIMKTIFDNHEDLIKVLKTDYDLNYTYNDVYLSTLRYKYTTKSVKILNKNKKKHKGVEIQKTSKS